MNYQNKIIYFHWNKSLEGSYCVRSIHKSSKSIGNFPLTFRFLSQSTGKGNVLTTQAMFVLKEHMKQNLPLYRQGRKKAKFRAYLSHNSSADFLKSWVSLEWMNQTGYTSGFHCCSYIFKCTICITKSSKRFYRCNVIFFFRRPFCICFE